MNYQKKPLFPKHQGPVQLPVFIRETSDTNSECFYAVSVHPSKLHKDDGVDFEKFNIFKIEILRDTINSGTRTGIVELNEISDLALREFVFVDDGSFYTNKLDLNSVPSNVRNAKRLAGKQLFNLSNIYAPLKIYRLKRVSESTCLEKPTSRKVCNTFWDMKVLDHSKNVPCSRSGHSMLVDSKNNRLFLMGGITVLADKSFQGNIEDIDNNWFYYPLHDVWRLDLETGEWDRMMDLSLKPRWPALMIPKFLSKDFKLPDFIMNIALVYDYNNDLIYGCYSPLECLNIVTERKHIYLISIDPLTQNLRRECTYNITGPSSLAIAYNYSKLVVHFPSEKKADVCIIPYTRMEKLKRAILSKRLLPRSELRRFDVPSPIRFIGDSLFFIDAEVAQSSQDQHEISSIWYSLANNDHLKSLLN